MTSPFDSVVGLHHVSIDLADNADAGFWAAGNDYEVVLAPDETVDGQTVVAVVCSFSIENRCVNWAQVASPTTSVSLSGTTTAAVTVSGTTGTLDALQTALNTAHGAGSWATATGFSTIDAAGVRTAVGLGSANLDTQLNAIYTVAGNVEVDTQDIQSRLPAALVSGRIDASAGAVTAGVVTAVQSGLSTIDAAGVRAAVGLASANLDTQLAAIDDYLDTELAAILEDTGTTIPAQVAALSIPTAAQVADKVLGRNLAGGSDGGRTVGDALRFCRNRWTRSGSTLTVYAEDDSTIAWTSTITTSDTALPVTGSDPS